MCSISSAQLRVFYSQILESVIKRPTDSTTSTARGQTETTSRQTSTSNRQMGTTSGQTSTTSGQTSTTSGYRSNHLRCSVKRYS